MKRAVIVTPWNGRHPSINDFYVLDWDDVTGQTSINIGVGLQAYTIEARVTEAVLANIKADTRFVVLWDVDANDPSAIPPTLSQAEIDALVANLSNVYYSDIPLYVTLAETNAEAISNNLIAVQLYPPWQVGIAVQIDEIYQYGDNVYQVVQAHTTQADWTPDIVPALFKRFYEPSDDPWPWVQPTGAHDAYPLGARVLHNTFAWQSLIPANVWEPGAVGSELLWENLTPPPTVPNWQAGVFYAVGVHVLYNGLEYSCRQAHTSQIGWEPPNVLALWLPL